MPPVAEELDATGKIIKGVAALIALLPGVAILTGLVDIPPSLADIIKALSFFISVSVILTIIMLRGAIGRLRNGTAAGLVLGSVLLGSVFATTYWIFADRHMVVVNVGGRTERHVIPINPSRDILDMIRPYQGDYLSALYLSPKQKRLREAMDDENLSSILTMLALLILANVLLVAGVVAGAWRLAASRTRGKGKPPPG